MFGYSGREYDFVAYVTVSVELQSGQIMAICLSESEAEARRHQNEMDRVAKTREAAELLSAKEDGNDALQFCTVTLLTKKNRDFCVSTFSID